MEAEWAGIWALAGLSSCEILSPRNAIGISSALFSQQTLISVSHGMTLASDTPWLTQIRVYFSYIKGSPEASRCWCSISGLIMPELGSL